MFIYYYVFINHEWSIFENLNSFYVAIKESTQHLFNKSNDIDIFSQYCFRIYKNSTCKLIQSAFVDFFGRLTIILGRLACEYPEKFRNVSKIINLFLSVAKICGTVLSSVNF